MQLKSLLLAFAAMAATAVPASAAIPSSFTITPGEGAVVESITTIEIFGKTVSDVYSYPSPDITINSKSVAVTHKTTGSDNDLLTYTLAEPITESGTYKIVIGAESFYYDLYEFDNSEISWTVTVEAATEPDEPSTDEPKPFDNPSTIEMSPAQGKVTSLETFTITFTDAFMADYNTLKQITLKDYKTGETVTTATHGDGPNLNDGLITLKEAVSTPGTYVLDVPEGAYYDYMDDTDFPATKWLYIVEGGEAPVETPDNYISSPSNGEVMESFQTVTVTFVDYDVVYLRQEPEVSVVNSEGTVVATTTLKHATASNAVTATFETPITEQGKYTFTIPKNLIILGEDGSGAQYNATVSIKFGIQPFVMPEVYEYDDVTISPVQGRYSSLTDFTLTFTKIQLPDINYTKKITLVDNATGEVVATGKASTGAIIQQLVIDLDTPVLEEGEYTLVCPEGTFYNAGSWDEEDLPEYKFLYIVDGSGDVIAPDTDNVGTDPQSGSTVGELSRITITYLDYETAYRHDEAGIVVVDDDDQTVTTASFAYSYGETAANELILKLKEPVTQDGHYRVIIPKRAAILGDMKEAVFSAPLTLEYTVKTAGIESVAVDAENGSGAVYNMQGIRVADSLENLPAGLYIQDGHKILVK